MKGIKKSICLILVFMQFFTSVSIHNIPISSEAAQTYKTGHYSVNNAINFRSGPSTSYDKIYPFNDSVNPIVVKAGSRILVTKVDGEWGYTYQYGKAGWVNLSYCSFINSYTALTDKITTIIDISQWQYDTAFNWTKVKNAGVTGVILRIGGRYANSTGKGAIYEDSRVFLHYKNAKAAGLDVGFYFFSYALDAAGAAEEAQFCIDKIEEYGMQSTLPVFIDLEDYPPDYSHYNGGKELNSVIIESFCSTLENAGYYTGLYTNLDFMRNVIDTAFLQNRCLWYAQYNDTCTYEGRIDLWQYSCTGTVDGFSGNLDMNICYRDYPSFIKANGYNGFKPENEEPTEPTDPPDEPEDPPYEGIDIHQHIPGNPVTYTSGCTQYGNKSISCTDRNCGALLESTLIYPSRHSLKEAYIVNKYPIAGENTDNYKEIYSFDSELDVLNAYKAMSSDGISLITYCTTCNTITQSRWVVPSTECYHEFNMTTASYKTTNLMYFRVGPTTANRNITDSNGSDVYIPQNTSIYIYLRIANWGYTSYNGYSGWVYLPYTTFISDDVYYYPSLKTETTCNSDGKALYSCRHCKKTAYSSLLLSTGHTPDAIQIATGSCRTYGYTSVNCKTCGDLTSYKVGTLGTHIYSTDIITEPSSTTYGKAQIRCYYCNTGGNVKLPSILMCDANSDGEVNAADARSALRFAVGMDSEKLTSAMIKRLDTDNNGKLDAADARNILRISVNLTSKEELLLRHYATS